MISTIEFQHGALTCAVSKGVFCRWQSTTGFGMRPCCILFDQALFDVDGWLRRCPECLEQFKEVKYE